MSNETRPIQNMKLKSFYKDNIYIITQSPHCGSAQDCKAMDFGYLGYGDKNLYAPCDMTFKRSWNDGVEYWVNGCEGVYIQWVHIKPVNSTKKKVGEKFGTPISDHGHITVYDKKWDIYLNYCDRSATLYFWEYGKKDNKWSNWATYSDLIFSCYTNIEMVTLQLPIKITTTNTAPLNIREQPNTTSKIVGQIPGVTEFTTKIVAGGTDVNGNKTWYGISYNSINGYISGAYVIEQSQVQDCSVQEQKIKDLQSLLDAQDLKISQYKASVIQSEELFQNL